MGGSFFEWSYRGQTFEELTTNRNHPYLGQPNHVLTASLMLEADAANSWGIDFDPDVLTPGSWFTLSRTSRAIKVAHYQLNALGQGLREFDSKPYWEKYYADTKPPRRGGRS